jgi:hypothetical protein
MAESKLEAARRTGSLTNVITAMREEAGAAATPAPVREQVGVEDAAIRVAAGLAGKTGAERRETLREVRPGATVSSKGVAKTLLSRQEKLDRVKAWGSTLTEEQRTSYLMSDEFDKLSDRQQEIIGIAFGDLEEQALEDSLGIQNLDLDTPTPTVDEIVGEEDDGDAELDGLVDTDYEALFETTDWEGEQS